MTQLIINGDISQVKRLLHNGGLNYDSLVFVYNRVNYQDVKKLFDVLLKEQNYEALKDYNECLFLVESSTDLVPKRTHYPMNMQIEHTSFCNARCIMCFHYYYHNDVASHMQEHVYDKLKAWLPYVRRVGLHGFGEPFLTPNLQRYLDDYCHYGIKLFTYTNLSVIPSYLCEYYSDFEYITISCDGATKEVYEGIRRNVSFDNFIVNVKKLRLEAPDLELRFAVVLMRQNLHQCEQFIRLAAELGINKIMFSKIGINYVIGNFEDSVDEYPETIRYYLQKACDVAQELGIEIVLPMRVEDLQGSIDEKKLHEEQEKIKTNQFWKYSDLILRDKISNSNHTNMCHERMLPDKSFLPSGRKIKGVCDWLLNDIYISATGRVSFCCSNTRYYIGDVNQESLDDIWRGNYYLKMIKVFNSGELPVFCKYCNLLNKQMLPGVFEVF